jgi:glycerol-3-phosphate acyltransferase PlsY
MSFVILGLIIFLLYATLSKYSSLFKTIFMIVIVLGITFAFPFYGLHFFSGSDVIVIVKTELNMNYFIHVCAIWFCADILVIIKIIKNYRKYLEVNSYSYLT